MSEYSTPEERTESPTERRMGQMRREGTIHTSNEVVMVASLMAAFSILNVMWGSLFEHMTECLRRYFMLIGENRALSLEFAYHELLELLGLFGPDLLIIALVISAVASLAVMLQTRWNVKGKWIDFRFHMLNPIGGLRRIFSIHGLMNTGKAIIKLSLILPIGYFALKGFAPKLLGLIHMNISAVMAFTGTAMVKLFWKVMYILIALAIFDYFWGKFQWFRQNKMTKDEVKDERKAIEGDEDTKRKIQQKGIKRIMQRIKNSVPQADVVITNPTHYAVALKYDRETMTSPQVVAKGRGFLALRIREIARENNVPVLERKELARALYQSTEVGSEIPYELFKAVAQVLAYVYRLKNPYRYMQTRRQPT